MHTKSFFLISVSFGAADLKAPEKKSTRPTKKTKTDSSRSSCDMKSSSSLICKETSELFLLILSASLLAHSSSVRPSTGGSSQRDALRSRSTFSVFFSLQSSTKKSLHEEQRTRREKEKLIFHLFQLRPGELFNILPSCVASLPFSY